MRQNSTSFGLKIEGSFSEVLSCPRLNDTRQYFFFASLVWSESLSPSSMENQRGYHRVNVEFWVNLAIEYGYSVMTSTNPNSSPMKTFPFCFIVSDILSLLSGRLKSVPRISLFGYLDPPRERKNRNSVIEAKG